MKKFFKTLLFITTIIYWIILICAVDSLSPLGLIITFMVGTFFIYLCKDIISEEDFKSITGMSDDEFNEEV